MITLGRARHLDEDRLFECYLTERRGEALDPPAAEHLADCETCGTRYAACCAFFDATRAEADAEHDELFTADHLRQQHDQILRRIEQISRSARVISFPGRAARRMSGGSSRVAVRWLAAAAAAGLFVGVALGSSFMTRSARPTAPAMRVIGAPTASATVNPAPTVRVSSPPAAVTSDIDDDTFLQELEIALERPRTRELQPFDALTPRVQEIGARLR